MRDALVVAQVALALMLLVAAGLMVKGFRAVLAANENLQSQSALTMHLHLPDSPAYKDRHARAQFYDRALAQLAAIPGVQAAAAADGIPFGNYQNSMQFSIEGRPVPDAASARSALDIITSSNYFETLHLPMFRGRGFTAGDGPDAPGVAIVNQRLVNLYWPHEDPIGRRIKAGADDSQSPWLTIIGVVADAQYQWTDRTPEPVVYRPLEEAPPLSNYFLLRARGDLLHLTGAARDAIASVDPDQPIFEIRTMNKVVHDSVIGLAYIAAILAGAGILALVLAAVGVYGVMAYLVGERVHEIGIRMALGATPGNVVGMVLRRGLTMTCIGITIGLPGSYALANVLASLFYGVRATDSETFFGDPASACCDRGRGVLHPGAPGYARGPDDSAALRMNGLGEDVNNLWQDIQYSLRMLVRNPSFTLIAILTLALGIGANTAIFSVVDAVLFRSLPYRDADKLVWATYFVPRQGQDLVFAEEYNAWRAQNHVFDDLAAYSTSAEYTLTGTGNPARLSGDKVTASFLKVLGVTPQLGRNFLPEEDSPGGPKAVLLSDGVWRSTFGGDPTVIGRIIAFDDTPYTIIGVLPRDFEFLDHSPADMLIPLQLGDSSIRIRSSNGQVMVELQLLSVVARLRPGPTVAATVDELNAINKRVLERPPGVTKLLGEGQAQVFLLHDHEVGNVRPALLMLLGAAGLVLLIACANVANLQLARATGREKEVAIRSALGAGRWRLARLLLTESSAVSLAGGVAGLLLASWAIRLIHRFAPANIPHLQSARLDLRVLVFTLGVSLLTGILFGLAPVMAAFRVSLNTTLKETGPHSGSGKGTRRAQRVLLVAEIALSFVLLIGAGLLAKSFRQLTAIQPGFDPHGVLTARVALPLDRYQSPDQQRAFFEQLVEKLQALPGVASAGATASIPLRWITMNSPIQIEGQPPADFGVPNFPSANINSVTPGYLAALRVPLIEGRFLDERDGANARSPPAAVLRFVSASSS